MTHRHFHSFIMILLTFVPIYAIGQVMQSTVYKIESDSINFGGGNSSSTSYSLEDTLGEIASGYSSSSSYVMNAGYQHMNESTYITLSALSDLNLGTIGGFVGGVATGTHSWVVTTNNPEGYTLTAKASTAPALTSGAASFGDYVPAGPDPDLNFTVSATSSKFGFSPEGVDVVQRFKDNGSSCNAGTSNTTDACWDGFSTTTKSVSLRNSSNLPSGSTTTIKYRAEIGASYFQDAGDYSAIITITALAL
ncbi:MAG: hypothetical protein V4686_00090 [Patescibacteria group bacterium]